MAINIGASFSYQGKYFLDDRQNNPKTKNDLKNWTIPVPEGFEIYLPADGEWYVFKSTYNETETGHFRKRNQGNDDKFDEIDNTLDKVQEDIDNLEKKTDTTNSNLSNLTTLVNNTITDTTNKYEAVFADKLSDLTVQSNWVKNGKNYCRQGIIVSVVNDGENNGAYILKDSSDYTNADNWIKLVDSDDLHNDEQTFTNNWNFENLNVNHITAETSDIKDMADHIFDNVKVGIDNMLRNTSFSGEYDSADLDEDTPLNSYTELYSQSYEYWTGVGTWEVIEDTDSVTGFSVSLGADSELAQTVEEKMIEGEHYVLSYKAKGSVVATIDGQTFSTSSTISDGYVFYEQLFVYSGDSSCTVKFTGSGNVCEIKLERGTVSTAWLPSTKDTDKVADLVHTYQFLKDSFKPHNDCVASGILLKEIIQAGKYLDGEVKSVNAGVSGIYNDGESVFTWSGGDFTQANKLIGHLNDNPNYMPTDEELKDFAKFAVTFDGSVYFSNARGSLRGKFETKKNGNRIVIDPSDSSFKSYNSNNEVAFQLSQSSDGDNAYLFGKLPTSEDGGLNKSGQIYVDSSNRLRMTPIIELDDFLVNATIGEIAAQCKIGGVLNNKLHLIRSLGVGVNTGTEYATCYSYLGDTKYYLTNCVAGTPSLPSIIRNVIEKYFDVKMGSINLKRGFVYHISGAFFIAGSSNGRAKRYATQEDASKEIINSGVDNPEDSGGSSGDSVSWNDITDKPSWITNEEVDWDNITDKPTDIVTNVSITGSGNAVTNASFGSGTLTLTKGTIEGGGGSDGNYYPSNLNVDVSGTKLTVTLTGPGVELTDSATLPTTEGGGGGDYVLPPATSQDLGGVKLYTNNVQTVAPQQIYTTSERTYAVQLNGNQQLVVNVPWTEDSAIPDSIIEDICK